MKISKEAIEYTHTLLRRGEYIRAKACYKSLLKLDPDNKEIKFYLWLAKIGLRPSRYKI